MRFIGVYCDDQTTINTANRTTTTKCEYTVKLAGDALCLFTSYIFTSGCLFCDSKVLDQFVANSRSNFARALMGDGKDQRTSSEVL